MVKTNVKIDIAQKRQLHCTPTGLYFTCDYECTTAVQIQHRVLPTFFPLKLHTIITSNGGKGTTDSQNTSTPCDMQNCAKLHDNITDVIHTFLCCVFVSFVMHIPCRTYSSMYPCRPQVSSAGDRHGVTYITDGLTWIAVSQYMNSDGKHKHCRLRHTMSSILELEIFSRRFRTDRCVTVHPLSASLS